ncbi:MAG: hypothetical protein ACYTGP_12895 [Planctomycetota bacterium]|jgi:hypothetical protein
MQTLAGLGACVMSLAVLAGAGPVCDGTETPEGEPVCADGYVDSFNGGLNSDPPTYSPIVCGESVCGETGNFMVDGVQNRDTDWYFLALAENTEVTWTVTAAGFAHAITTVDLSVPGGAVVGQFLVSTAGETLTVSNCLGPGAWALFVSTAGFSGVPCGSAYQAEVTCAPCSAPGTGACCLCTGECVDDVEEGDCFLMRGLAWYENNLCELVICPVQDDGCWFTCGPGAGGCYIPNGSPGCEDVDCCEQVCTMDPFCCEIQWDQICADLAIDLCNPPLEEACCIGQVCLDLTVEDCQAMGGEPQGFGKLCMDIICEEPFPPTGACCFEAGPCAANCVDDVIGDDCAGAGGVYQGDDTVCSEVLCVPPDVTPPALVCLADDVTGDGASSESSGSHAGCPDADVILGWVVSDDCGDVTVTATLDIGCDVIEIADGQAVRLDGCGAAASGSSGGSRSLGSVCTATECDDVLVIRSATAIFTVTATDAAGNASTCSVDLCPPGPGGKGSSGSSGSHDF